MSPSPAIRSPEPISESRKAALIKLLTDDDPAVYQIIRNKILSFGHPAAEWLRPHTLSSDPTLRRRTQEIINRLARKTADDRFLGFCLVQGEDLSLEQGAWMLAQTQYPEINIEAYQALFDSYSGELREKMNPHLDAEHVLGVLNNYLFAVLGYRGNEENTYDPENSYLNRVVDRRKGNSISLCLVYLMLAKRLRLPIVGIGLPGRFVCRYQTTSEEYYVDVFNGGKLWTKANCVQYLLYGNYGLQDEYLAPSTPRRMLMRICGDLHQSYHHLQMREEAARFQHYLVALAR